MKETFKVYGMSCAMCAKKIENKLNSLSGVTAHVNLASEEVNITYNDAIHSPQEFKKIIKDLGYKLNVENKTLENIKLIICILITCYFLVLEFSMVFKYSLPLFCFNPYLELALASLVIIMLGLAFYKRAIKDFISLSLGMDVLVSIGTLAAYALSIYNVIVSSSNLYFASCAMILTIVSIGKRIEKSIKHSSISKTEELTRDLPSYANVLVQDEDDEEIIKTNLNKVKIGDIVRVFMGETIPVDGIVIKGVGEVDTSILTGEAKLSSISVGKSILAGEILVSGEVDIKTQKNNDECLIQKIIDKVEDASSFKPPIKRLTDKIASIFVPCVLLIGVVAFVITLIISHSFETSIIRFASVILVSCPCALGLATPMALLAGSSKGLSLGFIFKSGEYLEYARKIDEVVFDKTKTLTKGEFVIKNTNIEGINLEYLVSLESHSLHPIANSILKRYKDIKKHSVSDFEYLPTIGIKGTIDKALIEVKNELSDDGINSVICLYVDSKNVGFMQLCDEKREDAEDALNLLKEDGINLCILTGDNKEAAQYIASSLGIKEYFYSLSPIEKERIIKEKINKNKNVGFVGDGVNDLLALSASNIGFAPLNASDSSLGYADVMLLKDDLRLVSKSIKLSKVVYRNIITNLIFAFFYNIIAIPLACFGIINPVLSSIMMGLSNILVVCNSLRIKYKKL